MALKAKLDKATYDLLKPEIKAEYKLLEGTEGDYVLDVEDSESLSSFADMKKMLGQAKTNEVNSHNKTKQQLVDAQARITELEDGDKTRTNDTKAIEERHKKALKDANDAAAAEKARLEGQLSEILVDGEALRIASNLSDTPAVLVPHIKARLKADLTGEKPVTVVLDKDGQPSAKKIEDLSKEFVANKDFGAIINQSKASGSGARQSNNPGGAGGYKGKKFSELSDAERIEWSKEDAAGFEAASKAHKHKLRYG